MIEKKYPLMRKGTAVWLVDNTALTFEQIADFCGLHELEIQGIADGDVAGSIIGQNPVTNGQLDKAEIEKCKNNPKARLQLRESIAREVKVKKKKVAKYTPIARRGDKPEGIYFLLKYYPDITNAQVRKLIGTTKAMIESIRNRTHWNIKSIKPKDPVLLGLCTQSQLNSIVAEIEKQKEKEEAVKPATKKKTAAKKSTAKTKTAKTLDKKKDEAKPKKKVESKKKTTASKKTTTKSETKKVDEKKSEK